MNLSKIVLCFLFLISLGCAKTDSDNVKTSGFYVTYKITGNNQNSATCNSSFQVGGVTGTYLDLSTGDSITCDGQAMSRSDFAGIVTYSANVAYQAGKTYNFVLTRANEGTYTSSAVLPSTIGGYSPSGNPSIQKGSPINLLWTASNDAFDTMDIVLRYSAGSSSYSFYRSDTFPEVGAGLGFGSSETQVSPAVAGNWLGSITFSRRRTGNMDVLLSGTVEAAQEFKVDLTLTD